MLYELLTGTPPFTGDSAGRRSPTSTCARTRSRRREINPDVAPGDRRHRDARRIAKNPANRYQSAARDARGHRAGARAGVRSHATPVMHDRPARSRPSRDDGRSVADAAHAAVVRSSTSLLGARSRAPCSSPSGCCLRQALDDEAPRGHGAGPERDGQARQADAISTLKTAGLRSAWCRSPAARQRRGTRHQPEPADRHAAAAQGPTVTIDVSSGPAAGAGARPDQSATRPTRRPTQRDKLTLGTITRKDSPQAANTVLSHDPEGGTTVATGTAVNLVVASGNSTVPDVRNLQLDEADGNLSTQRLQLPAINQASSTPTPGTVIDQIARARHDGEDRQHGQAHRGRRTAPAVVARRRHQPPPSSAPPTPSTVGVTVGDARPRRRSG